MERKLTSYLEIDGVPCGHQLWWGKGSYGHHFGCGVIAGIDGLIYQGVVSQPRISQLDYMSLADKLWVEMRPNTGLFYNMPRTPYTGRSGIGVYSLNRFKKGISKFANPYGFDLHFKTLKNLSWKNWYKRSDNFAAAMDFIDRSLKKNQPVHLLSWRDRGNPYEFHWLTIVGIKVNDTGVEASIMTWGTQVKIKDFESFWHTKGIVNRKAMLTYSVVQKL